MSSQLSLFVCILFVLWLYIRDRHERPMTSFSLWIPLIWIVIICSRPISVWLGGDIPDNPEEYFTGSPLDRNIFFSLIIFGLIVLSRRKIKCYEIFTCNKLIISYFIFCLISVLWADYPFISFKRWIKDFGNLIMVLIVITEENYVNSLKAIFARCIYVLIPFSVILIKYFPEIGRYYNKWTWEYSFSGITIEKNSLGANAVFSGLFLLWMLVDIFRKKISGIKIDGLFVYLALFFMNLWLLKMSQSSTSFVCLLVGSFIIIILYRSGANNYIKNLGKFTLVLFFISFIIYMLPGFLETFVESLGRNMTLTGRTDLWANLMKEPINPVLGAGYQSFWLGERLERFWEMYPYHPNQAHNGFLEIYLNEGFIGLILFFLVIITIIRKLKNDFLFGDKDAAVIRFSFFIIAILSNWTEATFNRQSIIWIIMIVSALSPPLSYQVKPINNVIENSVR